MNGWQRLWVLVKWIISIGTAIYCGVQFYGATLQAPQITSPGMVVVSASAIAGLIMFGALSALEWTYRGFRPKRESGS